MRPKRFTISPAAADVDGVCAAQAVAGAGNLTIDGALASGGVATMDIPRHLVIDSTNAGDTTQTLTITGTDRYGNTLTEAIAANGTTAVDGTKNFATVTQVASDGAFTGNVTVGTTDSLQTAWIPVNRFAESHHWACDRQDSPDFTYGLEYTLSDVQADGFLEDEATVITHSTITGETAGAVGVQTTPMIAWRATITSFVAGDLQIEHLQADAAA